MRYDSTEVKKDVLRIGEDIIRSERFREAWETRHHVYYNVASHSLETAEYALLIARWFSRRGIRVNEEDVVRAALLHDIGMTESPVWKSPSYRKAYAHPKEGCRIAKDEFDANRLQLEAIRRHMWPICGVPPLHLTGWIVMMADKASASHEAKDVAKRKARARVKRHAVKKHGGTK